MKQYKLTIFTPTYNRAYILSSLKESLARQDTYDFEWLIIDDGSTDGTETLVNGWIKEGLPFDIHYIKTSNQGKPRAINKACELARSKWLFIIDSDDYLADNCMQFIINSTTGIADTRDMVGVGVLRGNKDLKPLGTPKFSDSVIASNLERAQYGINFDCNEVYKIEVLKKFPFEVWPDEIFTPEEVVLNEMALNGYKLLWFNKVLVISDYLSDGMTKNAWSLIKKNPMGYAILYNHKLKYTPQLSKRINYT